MADAPEPYRRSPNCVYVGDLTARGERVVQVGTGPRSGVVVERPDGQRVGLTFTEVHR